MTRTARPAAGLFHARPAAVVSREVRVIPRGWQHPRDGKGRPTPMFRADMPAASGESDIVAYETVSEGTPISPAFPGTPEGRLALASYCAENCMTFGDYRTDAEAWAAILFGAEAMVVEGDGALRTAV